jgi:hypothetical protein
MRPVGLDDSYAEHPKVVGLSDHSVAMEIRGLCYSVRNGTDGFISDGCLWMLSKAPSPREVAGELVAAGRWERDDEHNGYRIHDYLEHNLSNAEHDARRAAGAARMRKSRAARTRRKPAGATPTNTTSSDRMPNKDGEVGEATASQARPGGLLQVVPPARQGKPPHQQGANDA